MPKAQEIFSIKKSKKKSSQIQGRETIQLHEAYRLSERKTTEELEGRMQELEGEECCESCLLEGPMAVTVTTTWPLWLLPHDCTHRTDAGPMG